MSEFIWDEILIMEYARLVSKEYRNAESWTWDYTSEEEIMKRFKISKQPKPEWEILKGCSQNGRPHDWESDGDRSCPNMGCKIYSVKRLGDGEVFTVGDEAHSPEGGKELIRKITEFTIEGNDIRVHFREYGRLLQHVKKPLPPIPVYLTPSEIEKLKELLK